MESHGVPGCVILSGTAWNEIEHCCLGETLSIVTVKGKGQMEMVRFDGFPTPDQAGNGAPIPRAPVGSRRAARPWIAAHRAEGLP